MSWRILLGAALLVLGVVVVWLAITADVTGRWDDVHDIWPDDDGEVQR